MSETTLSSCSRSCAYVLVTAVGTSSASVKNIFLGTTYTSTVIPNTDISWNTGSSNITFSHTGTKIVEIVACLQVSCTNATTSVTWQLFKTGSVISTSLAIFMRSANNAYSSTISAIVSVTSSDTIYSQINVAGAGNTAVQPGTCIMVKCIGGTQTGPSSVLMSTLARSGYYELATTNNATQITTTTVSWASLLHNTTSLSNISWGTSHPSYTTSPSIGYLINITGYYQIIINAIMIAPVTTPVQFTISPLINNVLSVTSITQELHLTTSQPITFTHNRIIYLTATQIFGVNVVCSATSGTYLQTGSSIYIRLISV